MGHGKGADFTWTRLRRRGLSTTYSLRRAELPEVLRRAVDCRSIAIGVPSRTLDGWSRGTTLALKNPEAFKSVRRSPVSNPTAKDCPWGQKALKMYLGSAD